MARLWAIQLTRQEQLARAHGEMISDSLEHYRRHVISQPDLTASAVFACIERGSVDPFCYLKCSINRPDKVIEVEFAKQPIFDDVPVNLWVM